MQAVRDVEVPVAQQRALDAERLPLAGGGSQVAAGTRLKRVVEGG